MGNQQISTKILVQILLSGFLLFHLTAILIAPNNQTYLGLQARPYIEPYLNSLELVSSWNFFAPDPGPPPMFIEYELEDAKGESVSKGRFPEFPDPFFFRERQNRLVAAAHFMIGAEGRVEKTLIPYLCANHPDAYSVRAWSLMYSIPSLQDVADGKRKIGDEIGTERKAIGHTFCEGRK